MTNGSNGRNGFLKKYLVEVTAGLTIVFVSSVAVAGFQHMVDRGIHESPEEKIYRIDDRIERKVGDRLDELVTEVAKLRTEIEALKKENGR